MVRNVTGLMLNAKNKSETTMKKVDETIRKMIFDNKKVNFSSIAKESGVSKNYLYKNKELKTRIEELRNKQVSNEMNQRAKFDKTSKSKDVIIQAKDKKIAQLEKENIDLRLQLKYIQEVLYSENK